MGKNTNGSKKADKVVASPVAEQKTEKQPEQPVEQLTEQQVAEPTQLQPRELEPGEMLKEGELPKEVIQSEELAVDKTDKTDAADSEVKADPAVIVTTSDDGVTKESIVKPVAEVVEDEFEINGIKTKKVKAGSDEELDTHMNPYAKAYPNEKSFYATTDRQVFLSGNKTEAVEHQRTLDKSGTLTAYEL